MLRSSTLLPGLLLFGALLASQPSLEAQQANSSRPQTKPLPAGRRVLSMSLTEPEDNDFDAAFILAQSAGMEATSLSLAWDGLETAPGVYQPAVDWLGIANLYYPAQGTALSLEINPIDTNNLRVPSDLVGLAFDDALVVARYKALLNHVFAAIPQLTLVTFSIGNEVDAWLGNDALAWQQYTSFFLQVAEHARSLRAGLVVGAKVTYSGMMGSTADLAAPLVATGDGVFVTYYPLHGDFTVQSPAVVVPQLGALVAAHAGRPVYLLEIGYPSGAGCGSSNAQQAQFIRRCFDAWDRHAVAIRLMEFTWLHDISQADLDYYELYYGISDPAFLSYLGTLGLRTFAGSGSDKPAWTALVGEAAARGW